MIQSQDGEKDFSLQEGIFQDEGDVSGLHLLIKKAQSGKTDEGAFPTGPSAAHFGRFQAQGELKLFGFPSQPVVERKAPAGQFRLVPPANRQMRFFKGSD
jgi:hypothetical protein